MILEPIVGLIHNVKLDRWHPVYFSENPLPGDVQIEGAKRYKSGGHHTEGFPTRDEALSNAKGLAERLREHSIGATHTALEKDFPWDGEDIPAMVIFFNIDGENATPLF
jgi:hypothetical protein